MFRGATAQNQAQVDQDGQRETDTRTTSHQEHTRVLDPICPGNRTERSFDESTEENTATWGISPLGRFLTITVVLVPDGKSDDVVPEGLGPSSLCTDEEDEDSAGGVGRSLIANGADGEGMRGEFVDGGDGEKEVLSWSPWSTFWGENGEADRLSGHQFSESVSGRGDVGLGRGHQGLDPGGHTSMSQKRGIVLGVVAVF